MAETHEFPKPGAEYTKVKTETFCLPGKDGTEVPHSIDIYVSTGGTPHFATGIPPEYQAAWTNQLASRGILGAHRDRVRLAGGLLIANSYQDLKDHLAAVAHNYLLRVRKQSLRKVIRVAVEIKSAASHTSYNSPAFSRSRVLLGVRSGVYWEINDQYYAWAGKRTNMTGTPGSGLQEEQPQYEDLVPAPMEGNPVTIPFTLEAWATIQEIESMLERAATLLINLAEPDAAQTMLNAGIQAFNLLASTKAGRVETQAAAEPQPQAGADNSSTEGAANATRSQAKEGERDA